MGICLSEHANQTEKNKELTKELEKQRIEMQGQVKLLMLGPGESGKSTMFKQLKLLYGEGFTKEELLKFKKVIEKNVVLYIHCLITATHALDLKLEKKNRRIAKEMLKLVRVVEESDEERKGEEIDDIEWNSEFGHKIKMLWNDKGIRAAYDQRSKFQLDDSAAYFLDQIDTITDANYIPKPQDALRTRIMTTKAIQESFKIDDLTFIFVDVGGQRSERRKWLQCFDHVTAVVFIVGINEYDQRLKEDPTQNRMQESLVLFDQVCNSQYFRKTNFILFLNKLDLFLEKLPKVDLSIFWPQYNGGSDSEKAKAFVKNRFLEKNQSPHLIYCHFTCAVDTDAFAKIFENVKDTLLNDLMKTVENL